MTLNDFLLGTVFLALPQIPLTLGNAVIAITEENNRLFPEPSGQREQDLDLDRPHEPAERERRRRADVPRRRRHGRSRPVRRAHRRRGRHPRRRAAGHRHCSSAAPSARCLRLFPPSILGVILFLTGAQLALGACDIPKDKGERFVMMITGALAVWNVGIAFVVGVTAYWLNKKGLLRV